jgi:hypothetical protein
VLDFYWTDPIDAMKRSVAKLQYKDKLYTTFQPGTSYLFPDARAFDKANSGMVFQGSYHVDTGSSTSCWPCFMRMPLFLDKACLIIRYTVCYYFNYSYYIYYFTYMHYFVDTNQPQQERFDCTISVG